MSARETPRTPPRVFISYAQYEPAHSARVLALAQALAADGLDVELDQFHGHELIDWPRWCAERLDPANTDFALLICSAEYRRRIEGGVARDQGRGVFWEGNLIVGYLYRAKANERFVPVLLDDEPESSLPPIVANWNHFRLQGFGLSSGDRGYEALYRLLTGQPATLKPKPGRVVGLGPRPLPTAAPPQSPVSHVASTGIAMDRNTFRQFKSLLLGLPVWNNPNQRRAFLHDVFYGEDFLNRLHDQYAGEEAADEVTKLFDGLETADIEGMTPACALLKAIREQFGAGPKRGPVLAELERSLCQQALDRKTFRQFKSLLLGLPVWNNQNQRRAFLHDVFYGEDFLNRLHDQYAGEEAADEVTKLFDGLETADIDGMTPACALLKAIREQFGAGPKREPVLAELERRLCQQALGEPDPLPSVATVDQLRSVLYLAANPEDKGLDLLRTDREFKAIREALSASGRRRDITLQLPELALGRHDLTKALHATAPSVVHFSGHGEGDDGILFEDEQGRAKPVSAEALASVFRSFKHCVKVVVLNARFSAPQAEAIAEHIDYVIGTREAIGDDTAIAFSMGFYRALAAARTVEDAFQLGCAEIRMADIAEHAIPLLMTGRGKVTRCAE